MIVVTGAAASQRACRHCWSGYRQLVLVDDFSVEAKRPNHAHLDVTERVTARLPAWLRESESQVHQFHLGAAPTPQNKTRYS